MYVISIIYIFMIRRRKSIIFGLGIGMFVCARRRNAAGPQVETFIGQDVDVDVGVGSPSTPAEVLTHARASPGHCSRKCAIADLPRVLLLACGQHFSFDAVCHHASPPVPVPSRLPLDRSKSGLQARLNSVVPR